MCNSAGQFGNCEPRARFSPPKAGTYLVMFNAQLFRNGGSLVNGRADDQRLRLLSTKPNGQTTVAQTGACGSYDDNSQTHCSVSIITTVTVGEIRDIELQGANPDPGNGRLQLFNFVFIYAPIQSQ